MQTHLFVRAIRTTLAFIYQTWKLCSSLIFTLNPLQSATIISLKEKKNQYYSQVSCQILCVQLTAKNDMLCSYITFRIYLLYKPNSTVHHVLVSFFVEKFKTSDILQILISLSIIHVNFGRRKKVTMRKLAFRLEKYL